MMRRGWTVLAFVPIAIAGCGAAPEPGPATARATPPAGELITVRAAVVPSTLEASGTAQAVRTATLSTKLMGTVVEVRVLEGDRVRAGDVLVRIDDRDIVAKAAQADAGLAGAQAMRQEAALNAARMRGLFADEAATRAQLDAAETALARADAAVAAAKASAAELVALRDYAQVRAPFDGIVTSRRVDPGSFAAPGAPLVVVQDAARLRVSVSAPPEAARLDRGELVEARIEGVRAEARVEGVVPVAGSMYTVNAIVDNSGGRHLAGAAAVLALPVGTRETMVVPARAIERQGDLAGVRVRLEDGVELRWVRIGRVAGDSVEVLSGLRDGEQVVVPSARPEGR